MTDTSPGWMLLLGPVVLLCRSFLFYLMSDGSVQLSDCEHHLRDTLQCTELLKFIKRSSRTLGVKRSRKLEQSP